MLNCDGDMDANDDVADMETLDGTGWTLTPLTTGDYKFLEETQGSS